MTAALPLTVAAGVALAATPVAWVIRHRGPRRRKAEEGTSDGLLLLFALVLGAFGAWMAVVAGTRAIGEARLQARWRPAPVTIEACRVTESRAHSGPSHALSCTVRDASGRVEEVRAGSPRRRAGYDAWMAAHPAGSPLRLHRDPRDPSSLAGFAALVPATTTADAAARDALRFGAAAALLLALSRAVVRRRRGAA